MESSGENWDEEGAKVYGLPGDLTCRRAPTDVPVGDNVDYAASQGYGAGMRLDNFSMQPCQVMEASMSRIECLIALVIVYIDKFPPWPWAH